MDGSACLYRAIAVLARWCTGFGDGGGTVALGSSTGGERALVVVIGVFLGKWGAGDNYAWVTWRRAVRALIFSTDVSPALMNAVRGHGIGGPVGSGGVAAVSCGLNSLVPLVGMSWWH